MLEEGVNVIGYVHTRSGIGEVARLLIGALERGGIPHTVIPIGPRPFRRRLAPIAAPHATNIVCVNPQTLPGLVETMGQALFRDRRTIGFWWWEVDRLPPAMAWASYLVDEIWVGSEYVRSAIESTVRKPVHIFPVPVIRPPAEQVKRVEFGLPKGRFAFVFSFHYVSVFERKNPLGLIEAFSRAFAPDEDPILVVKTIGSERLPGQQRRLLEAAAARTDVFVLEQELPSSRYHGLIAACDAYASLHRAEGFGLTIAEAMALGKPAVATGYSGNLAFMTEANSYLVPSSLVPVPEGLEPYTAGGMWADPDLDAAATILRRLVESPDEARSKVDRALSNLAESRSLDAAAAFIRRRLEEPSPDREIPVEPVERAAYELVWGPDLESARPWARQLRQLLRPFLRPYVDHHRSVSSLTLEALRNAEERVPGGEKATGNLDRDR